MMERQRSLPRTVRHHQGPPMVHASGPHNHQQQQPPKQQQPSMRPSHQQPPQPYLQPPPPPQEFHHTRTNSMGRLDPSGVPLSASGSQPCLLVAQTVSNRRKRHQQDQKNSTGPSAAPTHSRGPSSASSSKKKNFQRSESFHQPQQPSQQPPPPPPPPPQAHFFVNTQLDQDLSTPLPPSSMPPGLPPPVMPSMHGPSTPSLSPLAVVRTKRASQANWEKVQQQRRNSVVASAEAENGLLEVMDNCVTQGLSASSCTRRQSTDDNEGTEDNRTADTTDLPDPDEVPPPPSPPCTCGKNLELPPTPPLEGPGGRDTPFRGSGKTIYFFI